MIAPTMYNPDSSLDDVYSALDVALSAVTDLAILAGRHLPTDLARRAERALAVLVDLREIVLPAPEPSSPF